LPQTCHISRRTLLDKTQIKLDHIRMDKRHKSQRTGIGPDIIQCYAPSSSASMRDLAKQPRRPARQRPLGDFKHDP
jgi:hypothetical protein